MSLVVWLPLTKDLRQQGLSNLSITDNGSTYQSTGGKLGGYYTSQFRISNNAIVNNLITYLDSGADFSIGFWFRYTTATPGEFFQLGDSSATGSRLHLAINNNVFRFGFRSNDYDGPTLSVNTWYHIVCSYSNSKKYIYLNGSLYGSISSGKLAIPQNNHILFSSASVHLNDFRIYDHCLSPMEVKELAKGLVLHYPLNRQGWGQENLIANTDFNGISKKFTVTSGTEGGFTFTPTETIVALTEYTVSCKLRGNANMNLYKLCTGGNESIQWVNRDQLSTTDYKLFSITFTYPSNKTLNQIYICTRYGTANTQVGDWFEIEPNSLKLEKGSIATPWCPNSSDTLATTMGLNSTTEYDCSGFCNNGEYYAYDTNGSISYTSDTPKYNVSTHIASANPTQNAASGTRYLYGHCELTNPTQMSVAFWLKPITGGYGGATSNGQGYFCTTNYEYGNASVGSDYQASAMNHRDGTVNMNDSASTTQCNVTFYPTIGEWHHYVYTYDGQVGRGYKDGVQTATAQFSAVKTLDSFIGVVIGFSKAGGVWRRNDACYSDFRIYATALSADDVKSLYQNCATIDPDGTIRGQIRS